MPIYPEGRGFFPPFLEGHGAFVCDQDLALTVRIRDLNRRFYGLRFLLDSGLNVADVTEAPAADGAAPGPLVTSDSEGRLAATWAGKLSGCRAARSKRLWSW